MYTAGKKYAAFVLINCLTLFRIPLSIFAYMEITTGTIRGIYYLCLFLSIAVSDFFGRKMCPCISCSKQLWCNSRCHLWLFLCYDLKLRTVPLGLFTCLVSDSYYRKTFWIYRDLSTDKTRAVPISYFYVWPYRPVYSNRILYFTYGDCAL